jgi:putative intracellular protease/amidase
VTVTNHLTLKLLAAITLASMGAVATGETPVTHKVAVLLFDGAELIDYAGPAEVFAAGSDQFDVFTVAATTSPVATGAGITVVPKYDFATAPQADVLVIPGGMVGQASHDKATLAWIKAQAAHSQYTMSVCNGAFILANTGLLDGLTATTTRTNIRKLQADHPKIKVVSDQRFVDNGKIITTGGLSAGIDGALHVVGKMSGEGDAQADALYLEYDATRGRDYLPGTFAVGVLPEVEPELEKLGEWSILSTQGDARHWEIRAQVKSKYNLTELKQHVESAYRKAGNWVGAASQNADASVDSPSRWTFSDLDGRRWTATLELRPAQRQAGQYVLSVAVVQAV